MATVFLLSACSPEPAPPARWKSSGNLLENGSFENGREPWFSLQATSPFWRDFEISDTVARSGSRSARLPLDSLKRNDRGTWVWGVVRDLPLGQVPRTLSGSYRVQGWQQGTRNQYIQVAVLLMPGAKGFGVFDDPRVPLQMAWVLAGIDREPFPILNRKFVFSGPLEVPRDRWIEFEIDLHRDFQQSWGFLPEDFASIRILFEARFDGWQPGHGEVSGDVFFDDLYLGDAETAMKN